MGKSFLSRAGLRAGEWQFLRQSVFARDGYRCTICGAVARLECDHIQPLSHGGSNDIANLRSVCRGCHITLTLRAKAEGRRPRYALGYEPAIKELFDGRVDEQLGRA